MKTEQDTWGYQHNCVNYEPCPLCFGCRSYDPSWFKCKHCEEDRKINICSREKHTPKLLTKMIRRKRLNV